MATITASRNARKWIGPGIAALLILLAVIFWPQTKAPGDLPKVEMVFVEGDTFRMGDLFGEGYKNEYPAHLVAVRDFYLGKYEVTFDQYDAFCTATKRQKPRDEDFGLHSMGRGRRPVINVSWYSAVEYCNWLSQQEHLSPVYTIGKETRDPKNHGSMDYRKWIVTADWSANGYRLPTEAEWEFAARERGQKVRFGNGRDTLDPSEVNFDGKSQYPKPYAIVGKYRQKTVPVDAFPANSLGLKHMSGNVEEWCWDWYHSEYYTQSDGMVNPTGPSAGEKRVVRGGDWYGQPTFCRAAFRWQDYATEADLGRGFRLARSH